MFKLPRRALPASVAKFLTTYRTASVAADGTVELYVSVVPSLMCSLAASLIPVRFVPCMTRRRTNNSLAFNPGISPPLMLGTSHARQLLLKNSTQLLEKPLLVLLLLLEPKNKIHFAVQNAFNAASTSPRQRRKRASASIAESSVSCAI